MSDDTYCEVCRKHGWRKMFKHCPEGWFYAEMPNDESPTPLDDTFVVTVCSVACKERFFLPGPGKLSTEPEYITEARALEDN